MLGVAAVVSAPVHAQDVSPPFALVENDNDDAMLFRLEQLETSNRSMSGQLEAIEKANAELLRKLQFMTEQQQSLFQQTSPPGVPPPPAPGNNPNPGQDFFDQPPDLRTDEPPTPLDEEAAKGNPFDAASLWRSADDEWTLQFHNETQLDVRTYGQAHSDPVNQFGLYIPRMRMIFNGRLTKPIEFNVSVNKGTGSFDLLDAYFNFNYDPRFQLRIGRFRVPFTYDWYALSNQFLTMPERSVFAINYGYNRNTAAMLHGELMEDVAEYAIAVTNGPRNSYFDMNGAKDLLAYLNVRPFQNSSRFEALQFLNVGGSLSYGVQDQVPLPIAFRTSANATESEGTLQGVPAFLTLNDDVLERGAREQWEIHTAYYYKQLTLMGAWDSGYNSYGFTDHNSLVRLPANGWHVLFGYFLTGEEIDRRTFVNVLRPFDLRKGKRGPGAWELQARFDKFAVGRQVFTDDLADPHLWTNRVTTIDCGMNWYLNKFVRIAFDWQHCIYGNPVQFRPGDTHRSEDLFWVRFQDYF